jgi:hypothetical protein
VEAIKVELHSRDDIGCKCKPKAMAKPQLMGGQCPRPFLIVRDSISQLKLWARAFVLEGFQLIGLLLPSL